MGHDLLREVAEDGEEHEDSEELVLETLERSGRVPEGEADEETLG